ncbi:efflux transporter periplasmic adaptor subunit [Brevirhabdus pacifica]|uniref:Efflux transporter periplasmic adaptor subunit n=1 Tax=Brevirhabdus pacifica TaxID=1267768 RepID=A0A1U7DHY2_9RHOB|nr:HlyD family efflux transporter periplasmic adaptor subunit [Brevirhabdus pacifica]APX89571.1 efflux transporter periplasmic adaptor subunit [Brevirhabdus pacifica]OWU76424.1 hemolysin D [Loktanella sp. 22II-4b]PJJ85761.1 biotin/lipoyl-binding protein [Brevirhabdus pacifica]
MRFLRRSLVGLFLLAVTLGLLGLGAQTLYGALQERWARDTPQRPARERVVAVNVLTAEAIDLHPELTTFGEVRSRRTLELRAPSAGTIVELAREFVDGGVVKAGQVLLRIDPREAQSALEVARSDLEEAEAEQRDAERALELARAELAAAQAQADLRAQALKRQRDLSGRGVGTAAQVETAELAAAQADQSVVSRRQALAQGETRIDLARTRLGRARINLRDAERRLEDTVLRAEFAGTLSEVGVVQGGLVTGNERLARLIDPDALEVQFRISVGQYARLAGDGGDLPHAEVTALLDLSGIELTAGGRISRVSAAVGEGQTGRLLFAQLDRAPGFRPGDFVTVRVTEPLLEGVARLPASALDARGTVLVLAEGNRLETLSVELLRRQGDDVLVRAEGLYGREVVAERSPLLGAGIRVKPLRPAETDEIVDGKTDNASARAQPRAEDEAEMVELTDERRQKLIAFIEGNKRMPPEVKERLLAQLAQPSVPARVLDRLEGRMGG